MLFKTRKKSFILFYSTHYIFLLPQNSSYLNLFFYICSA